jgi:predicted ribonuclease YlaK
MIFYDTCALINNFEDIRSNDYIFAISSITLDELEKIKISRDKDEETKHRVRKLLYWMYLHQDRYTVILHSGDYKNADDAIIEDACSIKDDIVTFFTSDLSCYHRARIKLCYVEYVSDMKENDKYTGYKKFAPMLTEAENDLYERIFNNENFADFIENEYLVVNCGNGKKDYFKWKNNRFEKVPFRTVESMHFGIFKPRNDEQVLALDSMFTNRITLLGGPAGSGKSAASLAYLFNQLENGKIDRIIVFCNPVAAKNAAKLGFYPGELRLKLLSSQVGNVLTSKIGDSVEVDRLIDSGKLVLIPAADLRGYETPANSGVYIMEAQNYDTVLMRMLLQRIGNDCQVILDGDRFEQTDLDIYENDNGMRKVSEVFRGEKIFGQVDLKKIERDEIARIAERMK